MGVRDPFINSVTSLASGKSHGSHIADLRLLHSILAAEISAEVESGKQLLRSGSSIFLSSLPSCTIAAVGLSWPWDRILNGFQLLVIKIFQTLFIAKCRIF